MKIVFSRKGFDSAAGGVASPIFPSGEMCSLPIPAQSPTSPTGYAEILRDSISLGEVVRDLTKGRIGPGDAAHLDPDLDRDALATRLEGWHPIFGQVGAAEQHLRNQGVDEGDVFLFFGWFKRVERELHTGCYQYAVGASDEHCIFGWLQVGTRISVHDAKAHVPNWAQYHPHWQERHSPPFNGTNTLYIANEWLDLPGASAKVPGGNVFRRYTSTLRLTAPGRTRGTWQLPAWFRPRDGGYPLTFHATQKHWQVTEQEVLLKTVGRGQEFVLDCDRYPEASDWLAELIGMLANEEG